MPSFNFYARLSALKPQEPVSVETIVLESEGDNQIVEGVIAASRKKPATKKSEPKKITSEETIVEVPDM